jgi:hypothetical protein
VFGGGGLVVGKRRDVEHRRRSLLHGRIGYTRQLIRCDFEGNHALYFVRAVTLLQVRERHM